MLKYAVRFDFFPHTLTFCTLPLRIMTSHDDQFQTDLNLVVVDKKQHTYMLLLFLIYATGQPTEMKTAANHCYGFSWETSHSCFRSCLQHTRVRLLLLEGTSELSMKDSCACLIKGCNLHNNLWWKQTGKHDLHNFVIRLIKPFFLLHIVYKIQNKDQISQSGPNWWNTGTNRRRRPLRARSFSVSKVGK